MERFDRVQEHGVWQRLSQEDGCQLLGRYPSQKYQVSVQHLAESFLEWSTAPILAFAMDGRTNRWRRRSDFVTCFTRYELSARVIERLLDRVCDASPAWIEHLEEIGFDQTTTDRMRHEILRRREHLG